MKEAGLGSLLEELNLLLACSSCAIPLLPSDQDPGETEGQGEAESSAICTDVAVTATVGTKRELSLHGTSYSCADVKVAPTESPILKTARSEGHRQGQGQGANEPTRDMDFENADDITSQGTLVDDEEDIPGSDQRKHRGDSQFDSAELYS